MNAHDTKGKEMQSRSVASAVQNSNGKRMKPPVQCKISGEFYSDLSGGDAGEVSSFAKQFSERTPAQLREIKMKDGKSFMSEHFTGDALQQKFSQVVAGDLKAAEQIDAAIDAGEYIGGSLVLEIPYDAQETQNSCWYAAMSMMLGYLNVGIPNLTHHEAYENGIGPENIDYIMEKCGLGIREFKADISDTEDMVNILRTYGPLMCLNLGAQHVVTIFGITGDTVHYYDPGGGGHVFHVSLQACLDNFELYLQYGRASATGSDDEEEGDGKNGGGGQ